MDYRIWILIIILIIVMWMISKINSMIFLNKKCQQAISNIDVFLTRRYNIITNMQEVVKGYAKHEKDVLITITKLKSDMTLEEKNKVNEEISKSIDKINVVAEKYPDLKANENYLKLQQAIVDCEDNLVAARRVYNANVNDYNVYIAKFPNIIISNLLGYKEKEYFDKEKEVYNEV